MKSKILQLRSEGKSFDEIATILNCAKSTVSYHCNPDVKSKTLERRNKNRQKAIRELKLAHGGKCVICNYDKCLDALHFHHIDPSKKQGQIGNLIHTTSLDSAKKEAEKCKLICANCHAEFHSN